MSRQITEKVTCSTCRHFIGCITSDGRGPLLDECAGKGINDQNCPMRLKLRQFQPVDRRVPLFNPARPAHRSEFERDTESPWYQNRVRSAEG